jgi:hypothetical protein
MSLWWQPLFVPAAAAAAPDGVAALTRPAKIIRRPPQWRDRSVLPPTQPPAPSPATWAPVKFAQLPRRDPRRHPRGSLARPPLVIADAFVPPVGPAGVYTFAIDVEDGATVTYEWPSIVRPMWSGIETRASLVRTPRQRFEFTSLLSDAQMREVMAILAANAAEAPTFLLGLPFEELTVLSSTSNSVTVTSLAECDWAVAGQRVVIVGNDGVTTVDTWINGAPSGAVIPVGDDVSALALDGARIMPAVAVKLEADQGFERRRVNLCAWNLVANAAQNGFGATTQWGKGATVATHDGIPVWDRGIVLKVASQPIRSGTGKLDNGTDNADAVAIQERPDWRREIRVESSESSEAQWLKAMLMQLRGRARTFLLPTGRPDLVAIGDASGGTLDISAPDYVSAWWPSTAHRRIKIVFDDGTSAYRTVIAAIDNGNGTQTLTLASAAPGTIARVELLELCRLDSDAVPWRWQDFTHATQLTAKVVQQ